MKKVIFFCLLSISMCLSVPADQPAGVVPTIAASSNTPIASTEGALTSASEKPQGIPHTGNETANKELKSTEATTLPTPVTSTSADNTTSTRKPDPINTSTEKALGTSTVPPKTSSTVKPDDNGKNKTVSTTPSTPTVTPTPAATSPTLQSRAFDGASFIGGIILTLGLLAVGFMGLKYYKKQHAENYHTL